MRCVLSMCLMMLVCASPRSAGAEPASPRLVLVCAPCHGFDGIGHDQTIPNLAGQQREYLQRQMEAFRDGRRRHPSMDFFSHQVNWDEIGMLLDFYAALPRP